MWGQPPSAVQRSEASTRWASARKKVPKLFKFRLAQPEDLLSQSRSNHELRPILGEEDLPDSVPQAGLGARLHVRLVDDLRAVLHVDAHLRALILVNGMTHTQAAQRTLTLLCGSRNASQWQ